MKTDPRTPSEGVIAVRVPAALAAEIRRAARDDDRTVSAYLRRLLAAALRPSDPNESAGGQAQ
jgi:hypothetical protein